MPGIDECLREAMSLPGALGAALVDWTSGLALGTAGESPVGDHETTAAETAELARAAAEYESFSPDAIPAPPPDRAALPPAGRTAAPAAAPPPATGLPPALGPVPSPFLGRLPGPDRGPGPSADRGPVPGFTHGPGQGPATGPAHGPGPGASPGPALGAAPGPAPGPPPGLSPAPPRSTATASPLPVLPGGTDPGAPPIEDVIVTTRTGYHVLRFVETTFDSSVFLHLWLDRSTGNLALARLRLRELAERLVLV